MSTTTELWDWQRLFQKQPSIYWTVCDGELTGNFYDSHDAAMLEVRVYSRRHNRITIHSAHVHNFSLSQQRWEK